MGIVKRLPALQGGNHGAVAPQGLLLVSYLLEEPSSFLEEFLILSSDLSNQHLPLGRAAEGNNHQWLCFALPLSSVDLGVLY